MGVKNAVAHFIRIVAMGLLIYSIILSCMLVSSCFLINAITPDGDAHSVGLISFENELGNCVPHNTFVFDHYNGMETAAKVGGYLAPSLGSVAVLFLVLEFFQQDGCLGTKCIPGMLILAATICQGLTFLLFKSDIFCHNEAISRCELGDAGYDSIQAILMFVGCLALYVFGPNLAPFAFSTSTSSKETSSDTSSTKKKKKKKKKVGPEKGGDYTKEMYEQRRKEKKVKSRGVSGRSKEDIFHERTKGTKSNEYENSIELYNPNKNRERRSRSQQKYDDYVDTEPDGMDWSAFTPNQRDEYYERKRSKEQRGREREIEREKLRAWAREVDERRDRSRSPRSYVDDYSQSYYDESHGGSYYDDDYGHEDKYYPDRDDYDAESGQYSDYGGRSDRDSRYNQSQDDRDSRYSLNRDDYSYAQDDRSYADEYDDGSNYSRSSYSSSRRIRSGGRSGRDRRSYNGPV